MRKPDVLDLAILAIALAGGMHAQTKAPVDPSSQAAIPAPGSRLPAPDWNKLITEADCNATKLGSAIPPSAIGEPISRVTLNAPVWTPASDSVPAYCSVDGAMFPMDEKAKLINFRVVLPASWSYRAAQIGGGGMNGTVPNLLLNPSPLPGPSLVQRGFATYGSDSGHQNPTQSGGGRGPAPGPGGIPPGSARLVRLGS